MAEFVIAKFHCITNIWERAARTMKVINDFPTQLLTTHITKPLGNARSITVDIAQSDLSLLIGEKIGKAGNFVCNKSLLCEQI